MGNRVQTKWTHLKKTWDIWGERREEGQGAKGQLMIPRWHLHQLFLCRFLYLGIRGSLFSARIWVLLATSSISALHSACIPSPSHVPDVRFCGPFYSCACSRKWRRHVGRLESHLEYPPTDGSCPKQQVEPQKARPKITYMILDSGQKAILETHVR